METASDIQWWCVWNECHAFSSNITQTSTWQDSWKRYDNIDDDGIVIRARNTCMFVYTLPIRAWFLWQCPRFSIKAVVKVKRCHSRCAFSKNTTKPAFLTVFYALVIPKKGPAKISLEHVFRNDNALKLHLLFSYMPEAWKH